MSVRIDDFPYGHPARNFLLGTTPFLACRADPRFAFSLHVPRAYDDLAKPLPLIVAVHGIRRQAEATRERFAALADELGAAVLAPLFPAGLESPADANNFTAIEHRGIRYDEVLLAMIDEAAAIWSLDGDRFALIGFSAGGQFAHRFAYLHPQRLRAVSVGAPGAVTLPDDEPWPLGLGGVEERLGVDADLEQLATVPYQILVGSEDLATDTLDALSRDDREIRAGGNRIDRALRLGEELRTRGVRVEAGVVAGAGHDADHMVAEVEEFLRRSLTRKETP